MKHSVGLFSVLMLLLFAVIFLSPALAQESISVIRSIVWRPDGEMLAVGGTIESKSAIQFYDSELSFLSEIALTGTGSILSLAWSPDNTRLAILVGGSPSTIYIWDIASQSVTATIPQEGATTTNHIAWSSDSTRLAFVRQLTLTVWNENADELTFTVENTEQIQSFAWHPNGKQIFIAGADQMLRIWDTTTNAIVEEYKSSSFPVSMAFNPDGTKLAIGGSDGTIQIVEGSNISSTIRLFQAPEDALWEIAWSPQGNRIAAGGSRTDITVWDTNTGEKIDSIQRDRGGFLETLAYHPFDGRLFYATNLMVSGAPTAEPLNPDQHSRTENMLNGAIQIVVPAPQLQTPTPLIPVTEKAVSDPSILTESFCKLPCWYGLMPGQSTLPDVRVAISNIPFIAQADTQVEGETERGYAMGWKYEVAPGYAGGNFLFEDGLLHKIMVRPNIRFSLGDIISHYGEPAGFRITYQISPILTAFLGMRLYYPESGMIVNFDLYSDSPPLDRYEILPEAVGQDFELYPPVTSLTELVAEEYHYYPDLSSEGYIKIFFYEGWPGFYSSIDKPQELTSGIIPAPPVVLTATPMP